MHLNHIKTRISQMYQYLWSYKKFCYLKGTYKCWVSFLGPYDLILSHFYYLFNLIFLIKYAYALFGSFSDYLWTNISNQTDISWLFLSSFKANTH